MAAALLQTVRDIYVSIKEIKPPNCSRAFLYTIDEALNFRPSQRPISIKIWLDMLNRNNSPQAVYNRPLVTSKPVYDVFTTQLTKQEAEEITFNAC